MGTTKVKPAESEGSVPSAVVAAAENVPVPAVDPQPEAPVAPPLDQTIRLGTETIVSTARAATEAPAAAVRKAQDSAFAGYQDVVAFNRETFDALVTAGTILSRGLQDLSRAALGLVQVSIEDNVAAAKALLTARTVQDLINAQADLSRASLDHLLGESTRLTGETLRLAEDAAAPLTARVEATLDRVLRAA